MPVASTILGLGSCATSDINSGQLGCSVEFGAVMHAIALTKGTIIPLGTDLDVDYFNVLTQAGTAIPLMNAFGSETTVSDDSKETSPFGVDSLTLKGLPTYALTMKEGQEYYRQISNITGFGNYDWVLGDSNGNWKFALNASGDMKGFAAGQVIAMMTVPAVPGGDTEKKTITFQLTDRVEIDTRNEVILASNFIPITDVKGTNGVTLTFENASGAVPPANTDVTLKVKAVFTNGLDVVVEGMVIGDFRYQVDGSVVTPSGVVDDGGGFYTFSMAALVTAEVLLLEVYDIPEAQNVAITTAGVLLRSNVLGATVIV